MLYSIAERVSEIRNVALGPTAEFAIALLLSKIWLVPTGNVRTSSRDGLTFLLLRTY
jgi:hypothetical protein